MPVFKLDAQFKGGLSCFNKVFLANAQYAVKYLQWWNGGFTHTYSADGIRLNKGDVKLCFKQLG